MAIFLATTTSHAESFSKVRTAVFTKPLATLPQVDGISLKGIINAFIAHKGKIVADSRSIFQSESDFRAESVKLLHPRGVCSYGKWVIDEENKFTGLFEKGTEVPVIVRFSSGTATSAKEKKSTERIFGIAIKVFPSQDAHEDVVSTNIIGLDQYGFEASKRRSFFFEDKNKKPVYFTNVAPAKSFIGKTLAKFFDRFDKPNFARLVYKTAQIDQYNRIVDKFKSPYEVRFVPSIEMPLISKYDFRQELLSLNNLKPIKLDIWAYRDENSRLYNKKIGKIILDKSVVSNACDKTLHFHHNRTIENLSN
tara:strand:+ start:4402 stop:5325 length:924 start_codon:yes stop_codon:yes gene_type:complete